MRLKDKVVLVSGGARGIGREMVKLFASEGALVVSGDLNEPSEPSPAGVEDVNLDVASEESWAEVTGQILRDGGRIDVLVNNAGIQVNGGIVELTMEDWNRCIAVNQTGVWLGMRAVIPAMQEQGKGSIINFSSTWGRVAAAGVHAYHATKGAVTIMTKNAAVSYASDGIRVNSVHPATIVSEMSASLDSVAREATRQGTPMKRFGEPIEVAYAVLYLASDESSYTTGLEFAVDGGYLAQ